MSRSIHATRAELARERAWRWSDPGLGKKRLRRVARALAAKRSIKEEVRRERALGAAAAPASPLDPDALAIRVVDHGRLIHYPATEADLRAILRALPAGTADGLTEIELLLGREKQRATARELEMADIGSDPTGRLAIERLPGVFEGVCLGVYSPGRARIRLFAYVHEPALPGCETFEPYLKLRMLSTLVPDPRMLGIFDLGSAFEDFVRNWRAGKPLDALRVEFALNLHYDEHYALAHRMLDAVLAAEPQHFAALTLRADILVHERRLAEAEALVRGLLARDERSLEAWQVLTDIESLRRAWREAVAAASRGVELSAPGSRERLEFVNERARALLELGEHEALEADVAVLLTEGHRNQRLRALGFRAIALLRAGRLAEALAVANEGLVEAQGSAWRHELLAVRFEASRLLHPSLPPESLLPATLAALRQRGHGDWVERLCRPA